MNDEQDHHEQDHHEHGGSRWLSLLQAGLIGGIGVMLLSKIFLGTLPFYVHVRYTPLIAATAVVLLILAVMIVFDARRGTNHDHDHDHDHAMLSWRSPALLVLLVPILLGLLVPAQALGSAALAARGGLAAGGSGMRSVDSLSESSGLALPDPATWTLLDWSNATLYEPDNPRVQGQSLVVEGFVWRDSSLPAGQFMLSRFVVSCCSADGLAIGMPVAMADAGELANDQWVRVSGTIGLQERDGRKEAIIQAEEVTEISQPAEPYLYP